MNLKKTMISPIGNNQLFFHRSNRKAAGFSFIEVMITVSILSFGLVLIYRAFFISLNYMEHVTYRLHAMTLLDNKVAELAQLLKGKSNLKATTLTEIDRHMVNNREVEFSFEIDYKPVLKPSGITQVDLALSWDEGIRNINLKRSVYLLN